MSTQENTFQFALQKGNFYLLIGGFVLIIIGFILMSGGAVENPNDFYPGNDPNNTPEIFSPLRITVAPVLVLIGFTIEALALTIKPDSPIFKKIFPNDSGLFKK